MASNNIIELIFKLKDQVTKPLEELRSKIGEIAKLGLVLGGAAGFLEVLKKTVEASAGAQLAVVKFDLAFKNLGETSGKTSEELKRFAEESGRSSIFDTRSVLEAETALLRFRTVSGDTFDRARQDALDLASAMGTDLTSAAVLVGRSIERPEIALRQLRAAGITFTASQEKLIKSLVDTGQRAQAANIILGELEKRFKGAADVVAGTLSGALTRAKHAFDSLFETDTGSMTEAFNSLADSLNDPDIKNGLQLIISALAAIVSLAVKAVALFGEIGRGLAIAASGGRGGNEQVDADRRVTELQDQIANLKGTSLRRIDDSGGDAKRQAAQLAALESQLVAAKAYYAEVSKAAEDSATVTYKLTKAANDSAISFEKFDEIVVTAAKTSQGAMADFYDSLNDMTRTANEKAQQEFDRTRAALIELRDSGRITGEQFSARFKEALESGLDDVKVTVQKVIVPAIKRPFDALIDAVSSALDRMLNNGKFSFRELGQYLLREVLSGAIKKALDALRAALSKAFQSSSSGGGNGVVGAIGSVVGQIFSGRASGGWGSGWKMVGEGGPELVNMGAGAMTYTRRMMAGMGGGGSPSFDNRVSIVVQGDADDRKLGLLALEFQKQLAASEKRNLRVLERNGLRRPT